MNNEEIKDLIKLVSKLGLSKVEVERDGFKINIEGFGMNQTTYVQAPPMAVFPTQSHEAPIAPAPQVAAALPAEVDNTIIIKSSMIGTFYRSAGPDKDAFVQVGSEIQKGDKICIIEAMKLFNEIESEVSGKIVKVLVNDASPVEFDQPLFVVEPA
jgi:acetyl-CoA carboxylase biotin carboxyl carrier protein